MWNSAGVSELKTLKNALAILRLLETRQVVGIRDMAQELEVSTSAVHRICSTLLAEGIIVQEPGTRKYSLSEGVVLWQAGSTLERLLAVAPPYLRTLRDSTKETVHLAVRTGLKVTFPLALESARELRVSSRVGKTALMHTSATGKILLSDMNDAEIRQLIGEHQLEAPTEYSTSSLDSLIEEIGDVRGKGYATNVSETETGIYTIAVAVRDAEKHVMCALSVSAPLSRVRRTPEQDHGAPEAHFFSALRLCAHQLSEEVS